MSTNELLSVPDGQIALDRKNFPDPAFRAFLSRQYQCAPGEFLSADALRRTTVLNITGLGIKQLKGLAFFPALTELWCGQNRLTRLNVSCCPGLKTLVCEYNRLETLNVRGNPALEVLVCSGNLLARLNLRGNPRLTELLCVNNLLLGLNLSENPRLRQLWCAGNRLKCLDIHANPHLCDLYTGGLVLASARKAAARIV